MSDWDRTRITPWENRDGRWYKRDDLYAPLGPGSINGSKLRQLDYLFENARAAGYERVVTGCSILSPQAPMASIVGLRYGLPVHVVVGATKPETMVRQGNVQIAQAAGAEYEIIKVAYNTALQHRVKQLEAEDQTAYRLAYGITTHEEASAEAVRAFHLVGAKQAEGLPEDVRHLVVPFGSANSATSIFLGLSLLEPRPLRVTLVGIGPSKRTWMLERLEAIGAPRSSWWWETILVDIHGTGPGRYQYGDKARATLDGITFHPTYEGKIITQMAARPEDFPGWAEGVGNTALWIVGSEPDPAATLAALPNLEVCETCNA